MKSKRGFTLIELIAVIVILAIILVIGTLSIQRFITKGRNKSFDVLVNSFQDSAKTAYTECILKPNNKFCEDHPVPDYNESVTVTLGELIDAEFSDILKNPWKTSEECDRNSTVTLTRKQDSQIVFDYETCLICGDKKSCDINNGNGNGSGNGGSNPTPTPTKKTLRELIFEDNPDIYTDPTLTTSSNKSGDPYGLYSMEVTNGFGGTTGTGTTYYFRGNVDTNKVSFAGLNWRIIRINEDGTVRLILDGDIDGAGHVFNSNKNNYIYMYYSNSQAKTDVETWYNANITGTNVTRVATGNYFCEAAKTKYESACTSGSATMIEYEQYTPDLKCETDGNSKGLLNNSVGLINYDEVVLAGGYVHTFNNSYYLYKNYSWWTMSPAGLSVIKKTIKVADAFIVHYDDLETYSVYSDRRLRPVINLKANVTATKDANGVYVVD